MVRRAKKRIPRPLQGRQPHDLEEFVGIYFPSGELRDAARKLWQALESCLHIDLSGLHPDDDLSAIVGSEGLDSLDVIGFAMALEEVLQFNRADQGGQLGSVGSYVERILIVHQDTKTWISQLGSFRSCVARIVHNWERRRE